MRQYRRASVKDGHAAIHQARVGKSDMPIYEAMINPRNFPGGSKTFAEKCDQEFKG